MKIIRRQAEVRHAPQQMFELICDVERYPVFLPGCAGSRVLCRGDGWLEAELTLSKGGVSRSFVTRNRMTPGQRIDITLVRGPFSSLEGHWQFSPAGTGGCRVSLDLTFEIRNPLLRATAGPLFAHVAGLMVDAFCDRANTLYG